MSGIVNDLLAVAIEATSQCCRCLILQTEAHALREVSDIPANLGARKVRYGHESRYLAGAYPPLPQSPRTNLDVTFGPTRSSEGTVDC